MNGIKKFLNMIYNTYKNIFLFLKILKSYSIKKYLNFELKINSKPGEIITSYVTLPISVISNQ